MAIDNYEYKKEICNFLRNSDIFTISQRGVTTVTQEFNGDNSTVDFDLTNTNVKNVRSVTINSVAQSYGTDYTVDFQGSNPGRVTFTVAPGSGTNNVDIQYDYGDTDKIYPDFPRKDLTLSSYPRIGFDILVANTEDGGIGGTDFRSSMIIELIVYEEKVQELDDYATAVRNAFLAAPKGFFNFAYIRPKTMGPLIPSENRNNEILKRNYTYEIPFIFE